MPFQFLQLLAVVVAIVAGRAWLLWLAGIELHFDEAQYWVWSRHLDWGYATKGPLTAWLIAASTAWLGHAEWSVRLPGWLAYGAWLMAMFYFAAEVWQSPRAGWWAMALGVATPVYFLLGSIMSTDVFLFLCWTLALWAAHRALYHGCPRAWLGFGVAVGIGALGKLSIGLLPFFLSGFLLFTATGRAALRTRWFWLGLAMLLVCMSPVLVWNAQHGWVMVLHEAGHIGDGSPVAHPYHWRDFGEFLAGQWLALGAILPLLALPAWLRRPAQPGLRMLWGIALLTLAFFMFKAMHGKVQPNWPAPAYIGLLILFAGQTPVAAWAQRALATGLVLALLASIALLNTAWLGWQGERDPLKKLKHWRAPIAAVAAQATDAQFILAGYYQLASELAFYWPQPIPVYLLGSAQRRITQYDLWPSVNAEAGRDGVFVNTAPQLPETVASAFAHCQPMPPVDAPPFRTLYAWRCAQLRPQAWPQPGWH